MVGIRKTILSNEYIWCLARMTSAEGANSLAFLTAVFPSLETDEIGRVQMNEINPADELFFDIEAAGFGMHQAFF